MNNATETASLLAGFPELKAISQQLQFTRKEWLVQPGQSCQNLYYVLRGALKQYYLLDDREVVFRLAAEGDFCTSAYSIITQHRAFDYIEAVEPTEVLALNYPELQALYATHIHIVNFGRQMTERYFVQEQERTLSLLFKTPEERYRTFINQHPSYLSRFSLGTIAAYLGMTPETLSRVRRRRF